MLGHTHPPSLTHSRGRPLHAPGKPRWGTSSLTMVPRVAWGTQTDRAVPQRPPTIQKKPQTQQTKVLPSCKEEEVRRFGGPWT